MNHCGWKAVTVCNDEELLESCTDYNIYQLRMKSLYLQKLFKYSLQFYDHLNTFQEIANLAVEYVKKALEIPSNDDESSDSFVIQNPETLLWWFRTFRDNDAFPNILSLCPKHHSLSPLLLQNPDACKSITNFCKSNISHLTVELLQSHVHDVVVPNLVKKKCKRKR